MSRTRLVVMAKPPMRGRCKQRLSGDIGPGAAARLRVGRDLDRSLARFDAWATRDRLATAREVDLRFEGRAVLRELPADGSSHRD